MIKLLLLTCGTNANYHIARLLKDKFPDAFYLIGTDINKRWEVACAPYLDTFYTSPLSADKSYYGFVLDLCKKHEVDFVLPSFDVDQFLFYEGNPDLARLGVKSLGIREAIKDIYQTKKSMNSFLCLNHFPVPRFFSLSELNANKDYFVKPQNGVGSVGTRIMKGCEIDESVASKNVIEEICSEPEITLECFVFKGTVYSTARQRLDKKGGVCTKAKVYYDHYLSEIAQRFAGTLPLPYIFNLQFMHNSKREYVITDVNLRTAGGMSLSYAAGWDEVSALACILLGLPDDDVIRNVLPVKQDQYVIRSYSDFVTKRIERRIAFDLDGTLLNSMNRHKTVMNDVLTEFGLIICTEDLLPFKSEGRNNVDWLLSKGVEKDVAVAIQKRWIELIEQPYYLDTDVLFDGVHSFLNDLSMSNELYLITARNNKTNALEQIRRLGLSHFFADAFVVSSDRNTSQAKAAILLENRIDEMVGDSETDYNAACLANCNYFILNRGFRSENYWNGLGVASYPDLKSYHNRN